MAPKGLMTHDSTQGNSLQIYVHLSIYPSVCPSFGPSIPPFNSGPLEPVLGIRGSELGGGKGQIETWTDGWMEGWMDGDSLKIALCRIIGHRFLWSRSPIDFYSNTNQWMGQQVLLTTYCWINCLKFTLNVLQLRWPFFLAAL